MSEDIAIMILIGVVLICIFGTLSLGMILDYKLQLKGKNDKQKSCNHCRK